MTDLHNALEKANLVSSEKYQNNCGKESRVRGGGD